MALGRNLHGDPVKSLQPRILIAMWLVGVAFLVLASRAYVLQIVRGEELTRKGRRNFVQRLQVSHDRGIIYDRHGRILADNRPSLDLQVTPAFLGKSEQARATIWELARMLGQSGDELGWAVEAVASKSGLDTFLPIVVARDLTPDQVEAIEAERSIFRLDGVQVVEGRRRTFPRGTLAAHLLGYVNEIGAHELDVERSRGNPHGYGLGDVIGRDGIERAYERELRGVDGYEQVVVDAKGRHQRDLVVELLLGGQGGVEPKPGRNVVLTLDRDLQAVAEAEFTGRAGAVVALDPRSGALLALASIPAFDPNLVSGLLGKEEKERLDADPLKPWVNRTIQGQYAPGSTFKPFTAAAALRDAAATPKEKVTCPGYYRMGRQKWRCHKDSGHGPVDLRAALKVSCDTYFYTMSGRMGIDPIAEVSRMFGLGRRTGILLRNEQPGLVPDEAYHNRVDRTTGGYQRGMAVNTSIGQGSLLVTPLQLALAYAAIANGGTLFEPRLVERIETADFRVVRRLLPRARDLHSVALMSEDAEGAQTDVVEEVVGEAPAVVERMAAKIREELELDDRAAGHIHDGLVAVTSERGGTAFWRRSRLVSMAGKTGTAQVIRLGTERLKSEEVPYEERDHAWFVTYAPADDPEIVVAVLNEHSGHGSSQAAPIAVKVVDAYFELQQAHAAAGSAPTSTPDCRVPPCGPTQVQP